MISCWYLSSCNLPSLFSPNLMVWPGIIFFKAFVALPTLVTSCSVRGLKPARSKIRAKLSPDLTSTLCHCNDAGAIVANSSTVSCGMTGACCTVFSTGVLLKTSSFVVECSIGDSTGTNVDIPELIST